MTWRGILFISISKHFSNSSKLRQKHYSCMYNCACVYINRTITRFTWKQQMFGNGHTRPTEGGPTKFHSHFLMGKNILYLNFRWMDFLKYIYEQTFQQKMSCQIIFCHFIFVDDLNFAYLVRSYIYLHSQLSWPDLVELGRTLSDQTDMRDFAWYTQSVFQRFKFYDKSA